MASPQPSFAQSVPQGPPLSLSDLVQDTVSFLHVVAKALEGDDPSPNEAQEVALLKAALEAKYKTFTHDPRRIQPASEESLKRLEKLKREIERKNVVLETLQRGLKEFELEISLRSGGDNKE